MNSPKQGDVYLVSLDPTVGTEMGKRRHGVLDEIVNGPVEISLENGLRQDILSGGRKRKLKNISVKIDPLQITAMKKIATMKAIPYQTLIRHCLSQYIKKELRI